MVGLGLAMWRRALSATMCHIYSSSRFLLIWRMRKKYRVNIVSICAHIEIYLKYSFFISDVLIFNKVIEYGYQAKTFMLYNVRHESVKLVSQYRIVFCEVFVKLIAPFI